MHELSICGSIADIASRNAGDKQVSVIHLQVGKLRQIVPDTLTYCWSLVSADTDLAGSTLDIDHIAVLVACKDCGRKSTIEELPIIVCAACGLANVEIVAGDEFLITSLELMEV